MHNRKNPLPASSLIVFAAVLFASVQAWQERLAAKPTARWGPTKHGVAQPTKTPNNHKKSMANVQQIACRSELGDRAPILWRQLTPYAYAVAPEPNYTTKPVGLIPTTLGKILATCCKDYPDLQLSYRLQSFNDTDMETDVVYGEGAAALPITTPAQLSLQARFVPVVQSPGAAFLVRKAFLPETLLRALADSQYLLLFVLAAAGIAGVIMWMLVSY